MRREPSSAVERAWNPYSWRLREIAALADDPTGAARRRQLTDELVAAEALELAQGIRHVSIVHGDPATMHEADQVDTFLGQIDRCIAGAAWSRRRGDHEHVIIAAGGDDAEQRIGHLTGLAELCNPGHWTINKSARPDLTP